MDNPDNSKQLSLPALLSGSGAQISKLPKPVLLPKPAPGVTASAPPKSLATDLPTTVTKLKNPRPSLWYALYFPQLAEHSQLQRQKILEQLAGLVHEVSATVSFHPLALVCEVRSSLNYFGGIDAIHERLKPSIRQQLATLDLEEHFLYAASPTVSGSLLLARSGHNALVYRPDMLRSALGQLPTAVLELSKENNRRLYNMGIRYLRDIWRLPGDGLRKRFGSEFINLLHKALGQAPEPTRNYLPPPAFVSSYDLPFEIESLDRLLPVADEMLAQLCDFLRRRDLGSSQLLFSLHHEKRSSTPVAIGLRHPSRNREHWLMLLETHFGNLSVPAPIIALRLEVKKFDAFVSRSEALTLAGKNPASSYSNTHFNQFIEQLQARLGEHQIKSISSVAEHCPEYACQQDDYAESQRLLESRQSRQSGAHSSNGRQEVVTNPRPMWLLPQPLQLSVRGGRLYHRKSIAILSGPERIESRWWSGTDVRRDYYIAREGNGSRLWIYRDKTGAHNWYLHGFFA